MVCTLYMVQVDLFRVQMDLFWAKNDILGQIWLKKWKMFRIHKDIRFPGGIFLACLDGNSLQIIWTCFRFQMDQFKVQNCILCPISLKMWKISRKFDQRCLILSLMGQFFKPIILGPIWLKKWKISRKQDQNWMIQGLRSKFFRTVRKEIFLERF